MVDKDNELELWESMFGKSTAASGNAEGYVDYNVFIQVIRQRESKLVRELIERLPLTCENCGHRTTYLEADLRNFNTGMCGACGADALTVSYHDLKQLQKEI